MAVGIIGGSMKKTPLPLVIRLPSVVLKAALTAFFAARTMGSDCVAIAAAKFKASASNLSAATRRVIKPAASAENGIHHPTDQNHFHCLCLADGAGEPLCAADAGDNAQIDFRLGKLGVIGGDNHIAHHRQFTTAAQCHAAHRRDDWFFHSGRRAPTCRRALLVRGCRRRDSIAARFR